MSHISTIELEVKDLGVLGEACKRLGFALIRGKTTFKWYGNEKDARCDHAITVPGANYEIGVIAKAGGRYELSCDYFDPKITEAIGAGGGRIKQAYAAQKAIVEARRKGYLAREQKTATGIRVTVRVP
jgi:hypothetical protein